MPSDRSARLGLITCPWQAAEESEGPPRRSAPSPWPKSSSISRAPTLRRSADLESLTCSISSNPFEMEETADRPRMEANPRRGPVCGTWSYASPSRSLANRRFRRCACRYISCRRNRDGGPRARRWPSVPIRCRCRTSSARHGIPDLYQAYYLSTAVEKPSTRGMRP
jgi:hypothetical protein